MTNITEQPQTATNKKTLAIAGAILGVFIWSGWITISRLGVHTKLSPLDLCLLRFGTAFIFTSPLWIKYDWRNVNIYKAIAVALATGLPYTLLSFYGLSSTKAAKAGVIVNGMIPVFGALLALLWLKTVIKPKHFIGIAIILIANALMLYGSGFSIDTNEQLTGILFLILASITFSFYMVSVKAWNFNFIDIIVLAPIVNTLFVIPLWFCFPSNIQQASWGEILLQSGYQGIVVTIGGGMVFAYSIKQLGPGIASLFMAFVPAVTAILAFFYLGEQLSIIEIISILLCTTGIFIYTKSKG